MNSTRDEPLAFCTVVAKNYLARARVMLDSLQRQYPDVPVYVLFVDEVEGRFDPASERFTPLFLPDLELPRPREMCFRYGVVELSTAVRPFLLRSLLRDRGHARIVYLDPDTRVFGPLDDALARLELDNVVLTPHLLEPLAGGEQASERQVLLSGAYNMGFLALRASAETDAMLVWLQDRLEYSCLMEPDRGLYVDQRWMDLAPGMVEGVHVLRHPGYNVGHWNVDQRALSGPADAPLVNGRPLVLFHFSGFRPENPERLTSHVKCPPAAEPLATLLVRYRDELLAASQDDCALWPYSHDVFSDGARIDPAMRAVFRAQPPGRFPDPFDVEGPDSFRAFAITQSRHETLPGDAATVEPRPESPTVAVEDLAPIVQRLLEIRPDVRRAVGARGGRVDWPALLQWLEHDGVRSYGLKPRWCAQWAGDTETLVLRLAELYDGRPDLQDRFPMPFVEEHDAPAFAAWVEAHGVEEGFTPDDVARLRGLLEGRPGARIREIYATRLDVAAAYPRGLGCPADPGFVGWLLYSGRREHDLSADVARFFARSQQEHVCLRVHEAYHTSRYWQEEHPRGLSGLGRPRLLAWLQQMQAPELGPHPEKLTRLCPPDLRAPLDELRDLCANDEVLHSRFPDAFGQVFQATSLLAWLREQDDVEPGWVDRVEAGLGALGLLGHGVEVVGFFGAGFGLGELARATVRGLEAVAYPFATRNVDHTPAWQGDFRAHDLDGSPPFSVVHLNPDGVRAHRARLALDPGPDRYRIGYWAWELSDMPQDWGEAAASFDELWTCSRHAAAALSGQVSIPVQTMWPALEEPPPPAAPLRASEEFTFLFVYDFLSETERKNPVGLLRAFRRAFRSDDRVRLILKTANGSNRPDALRLVEEAAQGLRVSLQDGYLSRAEMFELLRRSDAYVSLHRAEGFGLTLVEAMVLGKPVIATFYSGNVDFMSPWNSFPVPFSMVEIAATHGPYTRGGVWAEPDLEAAAFLMRQVYERPEDAAVVGARGQADVNRLFSPQACGQRMQERFRVLRSRLDHAG